MSDVSTRIKSRCKGRAGHYQESHKSQTFPALSVRMATAHRQPLRGLGVPDGVNASTRMHGPPVVENEGPLSRRTSVNFLQNTPRRCGHVFCDETNPT